MKILITGGLGHIGSYLIRDLPLRLDNTEITILDNLLTMRYSSLFNLNNFGKYKFIEADLRKINLDKLIKGFDIVIHLAAITDAASSIDNAEEVESNNFRCTEKIVEACSNNNIRLIALSSTSVYGTQKDIVTEDCSNDDLKPQSPYALTKLKEENLINNFSKTKSLKAVILRFGTIFGISAGMRFHTAVNKFCWQASMGIPITVWETAYEQKRPYLDLLDASRAIVHIIEKDLFNGGTYNILTLNTTVKSIVNEISRLKKDIKIDFVKNRIMNQLSYEVSCDKFSREDFTFKGDLRKGIRDTICQLLQSDSI